MNSQCPPKHTSGDIVSPHPTNMSNFSHVFAVPGACNIIDFVVNRTQRSLHLNQTLEEVRLRYPGAELVEYETFWKGVEARSNTPVEWIPVSKEAYDESFDALFPAAFSPNGFLLGEAADHLGKGCSARYSAFRIQERKYFASSRPMTVEEFNQLPLQPLPVQTSAAATPSLP